MLCGILFDDYKDTYTIPTLFLTNTVIFFTLLKSFLKVSKNK
jgi:hypothetical protein